MESIEKGIQNIDAHTKNAIEKHKELLAKTIYDTAKKSKISLQSFEKQCLKIFPNIEKIGIDSNELFNPHTVIEFREGKSHQVIESWNKTDGLLPNRKVMGKYYVDKMKNQTQLDENTSDKMYYIPERNYKQDCMTYGGTQVKNFAGNNNICNFSVYNLNFKSDYARISIIEQNNKVINKYLNSLPGENIIKRGESRDYIFDFDATITFEIDNYLNLLHKPTGLYLMFNKIPFADSCFYFAREYNQLPDKEYYQIFLSKRVTDFDLQFTHQNYQSIDNRNKLLEDINNIVPDNYDRIYKLFDDFRKFQSFENKNDYELTENTIEINSLDPKDRIIEGFKFKLNETIKRCENSEKIISEMVEEYNKKSIKIQSIEREKDLAELHLKEMNLEIEKKKMENNENITKIKEEKDRELFSLYERLNEAETFKFKSEELGISMSSLQKEIETVELNRCKLRDMNNGMIQQLKQEKNRNNKLNNDNDELVKQISNIKLINDELVNKNKELTTNYEEKNKECWLLGEHLGIIGTESSDVLKNPLTDQIENLNSQIKNLTDSNKKLLIEKNKIDKELTQLICSLSNLI